MTNSQSKKESTRDRLRNLARTSVEQTDELLEDELNTLLSMSREGLEKLRPQMTDEKTYNQLIEAVDQANQRQENAAQFKQRLLAGGSTALKVGKFAARLMIGL